ncbi:hypothetical protein [Paraburkholderia terrae]|nr:hypothetical protein [Paraburkholderia terrae]
MKMHAPTLRAVLFCQLCQAGSVAPFAYSIESMRFANPKGTHEELKHLYVTLHIVETCRHSVINENAAELFAVDVRFR